MTCGDTAAQWVDPLGSAWSGTVGAQSLLAAFTNVSNVAATTVGVVPGAGVWVLDGTFRWTAALEGTEWHLEVSASTCAAGKVTYAEGGATDPNNVVYPVKLTRSL